MPNKNLILALYKAFLCMAMLVVSDPKTAGAAAGIFTALRVDMNRPAEQLQIEVGQARDLFKTVTDSMTKLLEEELERKLDE